MIRIRLAICLLLSACREDFPAQSPESPRSALHDTSMEAVRGSSIEAIGTDIDDRRSPELLPDAVTADEALPSRKKNRCLPSGPAVCTHNGSLWATSELQGKHHHPAVRTVVAQRALSLLAAAPGVTAEGLAASEVIRVAACDGHAIAVARIPGTPDEFPACPAELSALATRRPRRACPEWVEAYAFREGATIVGVGRAPKRKNRGLATHVAINRARSHATRVAFFDPAHPESLPASNALREVNRTVVSCGRDLVARVGYTRSD